jgi:SAM-dependent methyltransferase
MPSSTWVHTSTVQDIFWKYQPKSVLDIGVGAGRWGFLLREQMETFRGRFNKKEWLTKVVGVEIWPKYLREYHRYLYDQIFIGDIRDFVKKNKEPFDLIVAGDVIEHLEKESALATIESLRAITNKCLVLCVPLGSGYPQGEVQGNKAEAHLSTWEEKDFEPFGVIAKLIVKERIKKRPYGVFQISPLKEVIF